MTTGTWTGLAGDGQWADAGNWSDSIVPGATDDVAVALEGTYAITLATDETVANLEMSDSGATVDINGVLTVLGTITDLGGPIQVNGTYPYDESVNFGSPGTLTAEAIDEGYLSIFGEDGLASFAKSGSITGLALDLATLSFGNGEISQTLSLGFVEGSGLFTVASSNTIVFGGSDLIISSNDYVYPETFALSGGSFVNDGTISQSVDTMFPTLSAYAGIVIEAANMTNYGLVNAQISLSGATFINQGTVDNPGFGFGFSVADGLFQNNGQITISAGWASLGAAGTLTNKGDIDLTSVDFIHEGRISIFFPTPSGSFLDLEGDVTNAGDIQASYGDITVAGNLINDGTISLENSMFVLDNSGTIAGSGIFTGPMVGNTFEIVTTLASVSAGATIAAGNTLVVTEDDQSFDFRLDPTQNYSGLSLNVSTVGTNDVTVIVAPEEAFVSGVACFTSDTRIRVPGGELPVRKLKVGDYVETLSGKYVPITWVGRRRLELVRHPDARAALPIFVARGAISDKLPRRNMLISPDHALYLDGNLIPAKVLVNGTTIRQVRRRMVTYYHIELAQHDIIYADGVPAESYLDTGNRAMFEAENWESLYAPDLAQRYRELASCAPLVIEGKPVEEVRRRILARAAIATTNDPALEISLVNGDAVILSRQMIPGEITPDPRDRRVLGIKVACLTAGGKTIPLDHPDLNNGWHAFEADGRWTNGRAIIPVSLLQGAVDIKLIVRALPCYPLFV